MTRRQKPMPPAAAFLSAHREPPEKACVRRNGDDHVEAESEPEPSAAAGTEPPESAGAAEAEPVCTELSEPAGE